MKIGEVLEQKLGGAQTEKGKGVEEVELQVRLKVRWDRKDKRPQRTHSQRPKVFGGGSCG